VEEYIDEVAGMGGDEPRRTKRRRKTEGGS